MEFRDPPTTAIVRDVPDTYDRCIRKAEATDPIDVDEAKRQQRAYVEKLEAIGFDVVRVPADDGFPDCCFVEDTGMVVDDVAVLGRFEAEARAGEEDAVDEILARYADVHRVQEPATVEFGDVIRMGDRIFVGLSLRTNREAVDQIREIVGPRGFDVTSVAVDELFHMRTACTPIGSDMLLLAPGYLDESAFSGIEIVKVPEDERHAANVVVAGDRVVVPDGAPKTREMLEERGFETHQTDGGEFRKAEGSLTCLSLRF